MRAGWYRFGAWAGLCAAKFALAFLVGGVVAALWFFIDHWALTPLFGGTPMSRDNVSGVWAGVALSYLMWKA
jgi:hypothetical protein